MFSFRKTGAPILAALLIVSLPAWSVNAAEAPVKAATKKTEVKVKAKEPAKSKKRPQEQAKVQPKTSPDDVMARVNGTSITRLEVERAVKVMLAQNNVPQPLEPEIMEQAQAAALDQLISAELLYQEAAKLEMKDLDKLVAEKIAQNKAKFSSEAEFDQAMKGVDMTPQDMQDFSRKDILINNFIEKRFAAKAAVTDLEARKFYDDNLDKHFKKPESARASHILIGIDDETSTEDRMKASEKAEAIWKRLKAGGDFEAIAKADSTCPSSAQGGDLGTFSRGQMVPPFEKAAFALMPGEISEVVETDFGYHIIKLTEKQEASTQSFNSQKERISEFLKGEKVQTAINQFITEQRKTAKIEKP